MEPSVRIPRTQTFPQETQVHGAQVVETVGASDRPDWQANLEFTWGREAYPGEPFWR